jgi:hypothetical protein
MGISVADFYEERLNAITIFLYYNAATIAFSLLKIYKGINSDYEIISLYKKTIFRTISGGDGNSPTQCGTAVKQPRPIRQFVTLQHYDISTIQ